MSDTYEVLWRNLRATKDELTDYLSNSSNDNSLEHILGFERGLILIKPINTSEIASAYSVSGILAESESDDNAEINDNICHTIKLTPESERWPSWKYLSRLKNKGTNTEILLTPNFELSVEEYSDNNIYHYAKEYEKITGENFPLAHFLFQEKKAFPKLHRIMDKKRIKVHYFE